MVRRRPKVEAGFKCFEREALLGGWAPEPPVNVGTGGCLVFRRLSLFLAVHFAIKETAVIQAHPSLCVVATTRDACLPARGLAITIRSKGRPGISRASPS